MKKYIYYVSILAATLFASSSMQAYFWHIKNSIYNQEGKYVVPVLIQVELQASNNPYFVLTQPLGVAKFEWAAGSGKEKHWLNKIKYVIVDDAFLNNKELIQDKTTVINNDKMLTWLDANKAKYPRKEATFAKNAIASPGSSVKQDADVVLQGRSDGSCEAVFYPFTGSLK